MLPKISVEFLKSIQACESGVNAYIRLGKPENLFDVLDAFEAKRYFSHSAWLITQLLDAQNNVRFAIYCAELVLPLFEGQYKEVSRPRKAIESAKNWLLSQDSVNVVAAYDAAHAANAAAYAVHAAHAAARAAAYTVRAAAYTARAAAYAAADAAYAAAAVYAAADTTNAAAYAAAAARDAAHTAAYAARAAAAASAASYDAAAAADVTDGYSKIIEYAKTLLKEQYENV